MWRDRKRATIQQPAKRGAQYFFAAACRQNRIDGIAFVPILGQMVEFALPGDAHHMDRVFTCEAANHRAVAHFHATMERKRKTISHDQYPLSQSHELLRWRI